MNTDDLRNQLGNEAGTQPPVSGEFREEVDHEVRRQRMRAAAALAPLAVVVVVLGALVVTRRSPDATVATAGDAATPGTAGSTQAPSPQSPGTSTTQAPSPPNTNNTAGPAGSSTSNPTATPNTSCGTVTLSMMAKSLPDPKAFTCLMEAFNRNATASLVVVMESPDGGSITSTVTTASGHLVKLDTTGTMTVKVPGLSLLGKLGNPNDSGGPTDGACGTITITPDEHKLPDMTAARCLLDAVRSGADATFTIIVKGADAGSMTTAMHIASDQTITISVGGSWSVKLPDDLTIPDSIINAIPPNNLGLEGAWQLLPGKGLWPGGDKSTDATDPH